MKQVDLLIVGAGPAGLCAGIAGAQAGASVMIIDENLSPGGQLFKQIHKFFGSREHNAGVRGFDIGSRLLEQTRELGVDVRLGYPVYGILDGNTVLYGTRDGMKTIRPRRIVIATGANENNLFFPGSTLPGVMTAGAAQTMMNVHHVKPGQKVVMIGSGNVGLIVCYQMLQAGIDVVALVEAADQIGGYDVHANKLRRAGVPIYCAHTVKSVEGDGRVERVILTKLDHFKPIEGTEFTVEADTVCMAVGLTPMVELAGMAGCRMTECPALGGVVPAHDEHMQTSETHIYVAGDVAGVEEASTAMEEGRLAGLSAAASLGYIEKDDAEAQCEAIRTRLLALRSGHFGQRRAEAKAKIIADYHS